jgi:Zn finger protein HypA/HybF involved in hydrogenase expression
VLRVCRRHSSGVTGHVDPDLTRIFEIGATRCVDHNADQSAHDDVTENLPAAPSQASLGPSPRVHVWCKSCRHAKDADLAAQIAGCKGDVPLVQMKWHCSNCGSRLTEFIVGGLRT